MDGSIRTMKRTVVTGVPLAGKTALMSLLAHATGAPLWRVPVAVTEGAVAGATLARLDLKLDELYLVTMPGGAPADVQIPLVEQAEVVVFVFDCRSTRAEDQRRLWRALQPHWSAGPAAYVINRRKEADVPSDEVLRSVGADPSRPCIELSLGEQNEAPRLRDFIVALTGAAVNRS
jgi:hypothetical protein